MPIYKGKQPTHPAQNKWARFARGDFSHPSEMQAPVLEMHPSEMQAPVAPEEVPSNERNNKYAKYLEAYGAEFEQASTTPEVFQGLNTNKLTPLKAAYDAGNGQIYTLNIPASREANFFVLGCQGNGHISQKDVAELMNRIAANNPPDFILIVGDNFYDHGVSSPNDPIFKKNFTDIYANPALTHIAGIPCFAILGNHDENIHNLRKPWASKGVKRGMFQVAHSYITEKVAGLGNRIVSTYEKTRLYAKKKLNLKFLPKWNMPSRYYSLIAGNTQIFCIDSNTYVEDYIKYQVALKLGKASELNTNNQALWLEREVVAAKAQGRKVILASHHPISTPGKRSFGSDTKLYLDSGTQKLFEKFYKDFYAGTTQQTIKANKESYNTLLHETFKMQWKTQKSNDKDFTIDTIFAAHDHDLYYINNENKPGEFPIREIVSGGGGGHLQNLVKYDEHLAFFMKQNGFVRCETFGDEKNFGEPTLRYHIYTTNARDKEHHLVFTEKDTKPTRDYTSLNKPEQKAVETFCKIVHDAITEYLTFVTKKQNDYHGKFFSHNFSHGAKGVERAHKLWAYISNYEVDNLEKTVETVFEMTKWKGRFTAPTEHSLVTILNRKMKQHYHGRGLADLNQVRLYHTPPAAKLVK